MRAVLCGYYGQGNGGDEALLATLLQMLPDHVTPIVLSGNPRETETRYGVEAQDRKSKRALLQVIRSADAFIFGGGSLVQDVTSPMSAIYYCGLMITAQRLGLRTLAWGQGIGPLHRAPLLWLAKQTFQQCDIISVRDGASAQLLNDWQIPCLLAPDPVWALEAISATDRTHNLSDDPSHDLSDLPEPRVSISLRPHASLTADRLHLLATALAQLQQKTGASIVLLPFQNSQDLPIAHRIAPYLLGPHRIVSCDDPRRLKGLFQQVSLAISMRLHGLIMAASEGCRTTALSYDPKVTQLMAETQIPGWELAAIPTDPAVISQTWADLLTGGVPFSTHQIQSLRDRAWMHRDVLCNGLMP
jgi:polysaccharide pyruvyl transferase CsaB